MEGKQEPGESETALRDEIAELESRLLEAQAKLKAVQLHDQPSPSPGPSTSHPFHMAVTVGD
jgi:hypothetical protein